MSRRHQPRTDHADLIDPSDVHTCPGPCNAGYRRAQAALEDERAAAKAEHRPPAVELTAAAHEAARTAHAGKPTWCRDVHAFNHAGVMLDTLDHRGCGEAILDRLHRLPDLAAHLTPGALNTPRGADVDPSGHHGGGARALSHAPSPSSAWDTADELVRWLVDLEDWLRAELGHEAADVSVVQLGRLRGVTFTTERRTLSAAVTYLHGHGEALLSSSDAATAGRDILATYRRLEHLTGRDRLVHRLTEPCPRCGRKGLRRADGGELVSCGSCRATWDWEHFEHLCRVYAETVKADRGVTA